MLSYINSVFSQSYVNYYARGQVSNVSVHRFVVQLCTYPFRPIEQVCHKWTYSEHVHYLFILLHSMYVPL